MITPEEKTYLKELGQKLKEFRKSKNMTQQELADRCGLDRNYISMLERGDRNPSYLTMLKIKNGCGFKF